MCLSDSHATYAPAQSETIDFRNTCNVRLAGSAKTLVHPPSRLIRPPVDDHRVAVGPEVRAHRGLGVPLVRVLGDGLRVANGVQGWRRHSRGRPLQVAPWRRTLSWRRRHAFPHIHRILQPWWARRLSKERRAVLTTAAGVVRRPQPLWGRHQRRCWPTRGGLNPW